MINPEHLKELADICDGARELTEGGRMFIHLPKLRFLAAGQPLEIEALLCPQEHNGYSTRLFLPKPIAGRGANWSVHHILGRTWHSWSWQGINANLRLAEILAAHLRALR